MEQKAGEGRAGIRLDKWLWAARFFKTRALAAAACDSGRIACNAQPAKPSRLLKPGDTLQIRSEAGDFTVEVLIPAEARGSAAVAQTMFRESDESRELRARAAAERKAMLPAEPRGPGSPGGRPSKRDRRLIHRFRGD